MNPINKPDITNIDPRYWNEVLASHDLSLERGGDSDEIDDDPVTEQDLVENYCFDRSNPPEDYEWRGEYEENEDEDG